MRSIELTEEHKSKLLEMCRQLFPNIFTPTIQDNGYINYSYTGKTINYEDSIHWFEFCMTYLTNKLSSLLPFNGRKQNLNVKLILYLEHEQNIIDYLYEEFKKLK